MTAIDDDRTELDEALDDCNLRILLVSGSDSTSAEAIHDKAEGIDNPSFRVFWIRDLDVLTDDERNEWFAMGGRYAVICECDDNGERRVSARGNHSALVLPSGAPSVIRIRTAFATCTVP